MTELTEDLELEVSRIVSAPRDAVFDAWLDPEMLTRFMAPVQGMSVSQASTDPRVGGRFLIMMVREGTDLPHEGTYRVIDRPNRLEFTWESPHSKAENSTVTVNFTDVSGGTEVKLRHVRFLTEQARNGHLAGWTGILDALASSF